MEQGMQCGIGNVQQIYFNSHRRHPSYLITIKIDTTTIFEFEMGFVALLIFVLQPSRDYAVMELLLKIFQVCSLGDHEGHQGISHQTFSD